MNYEQAVKEKLEEAGRFYKDNCANWRCMARPPSNLHWLFYIAFGGIRLDRKMPNKFANPLCDMSHVSKDKLARTYHAIGELIEWMERVNEAQKRHQLEIERQCQSKIISMETHAALK